MVAKLLKKGTETGQLQVSYISLTKRITRHTLQLQQEMLITLCSKRNWSCTSSSFKL